MYSKLRFSSNSVKKQQGAGLIETMVSLLILGVGLLGVLSLQANGVSSNQRAIFVTEAQILAQDIADRIRAFGDDGLGARNSEFVPGGVPADTGAKGGNQEYTVECASECDAAETVANDLAQWEDAVDLSSLPNGRGRLLFDDATNQYTVRIFWDQERTGAAQLIDNDDSCVGDNAVSKGADGFLTCYDIFVSTYRD